VHVISASRGVGQERDAHFPPQISGVYADRSRGRDIDIRYDVRGSSMRSALVLLIAFAGTMLFGVRSRVDWSQTSTDQTLSLV
jgi:hypothetical protein